jgi:hypothetical protein
LVQHHNHMCHVEQEKKGGAVCVDKVNSKTQNESTKVQEKIAYGLIADCHARLLNEMQ